MHSQSQQAPSTKGGLLAIKPGYGVSKAATALLAGGGDVAHVSVFRSGLARFWPYEHKSFMLFVVFNLMHGLICLF